jgi:hypothetical protein
MAKVEITGTLRDEIFKKFKGESKIILKQLYSLEKNPHKGKSLSSVGKIVIKEMKYKSFRFYFITDGHKLRALDQYELINLLIKFIFMSDKKHQQETIEKIKEFLKTFGEKSSNK